MLKRMPEYTLFLKKKKHKPSLAKLAKILVIIAKLRLFPLASY